MKNFSQIKERILRIINTEKDRTNQEIEELLQKQRAQSFCYGYRGFYNRYEKAIARRKSYLSELDSLKQTTSKAVVFDKLSLHAYYCPTCNQHIYTEYSSTETVSCPCCERKIWRDGKSVTWDIVKDSKQVKLRYT